jgi:hypothetical protein
MQRRIMVLVLAPIGLIVALVVGAFGAAYWTVSNPAGDPLPLPAAEIGLGSEAGAELLETADPVDHDRDEPVPVVDRLWFATGSSVGQPARRPGRGCAVHSAELDDHRVRIPEDLPPLGACLQVERGPAGRVPDQHEPPRGHEPTALALARP